MTNNLKIKVRLDVAAVLLEAAAELPEEGPEGPWPVVAAAVVAAKCGLFTLA